ncbi:alanyl-tRNA synthetase [Melghirimyces thermohalophilus]|uniref:Alanine--tRNA ligase n=2 Tax=Melghirimyces thermohalophilus TaxID=1236220 RepID=A0A1G6N0M9_9BACL|nr:alanyl-tRNA synthetase [Melghirimyces thermohalophilus]
MKRTFKCDDGTEVDRSSGKRGRSAAERPPRLRRLKASFLSAGETKPAGALAVILLRDPWLTGVIGVVPREPFSSRNGMEGFFYFLKGVITMKGNEIRRKFLDFFQEKGHRVEPSASLVPVDDPSLLWINSGVATLKKYFDGRVKPENPRIVNAQKSIRTNDIENVGYTARHHTFFEMLGNFSIGDYFKEEAILWAWEFLTDPKWMGMDPERLSVTIHPEDDEALSIWHRQVGIPLERIVKLEENFWDIGEGPSGPNTEIFYDRGEAFGDLSDPECYPGGENERFLEIWNLVFSQFNHNPDGSYTPLPRKNIDTGMGLERMASVMQNVRTNFDTDLFQPIIQVVCTEAGVRYGESQEVDTALKVIADHIRTLVFAIGDGVTPSNEGRGYVLRRLLRRAVRFSRTLGIHKAFLYRLTDVVAEMMQDFYPQPLRKKGFIQQVIRNEEERFLETLSDGLHILEGMVSRLKTEGKTQISGRDAFTLYDTYGFPVDLTEDFAREQGMTVDTEGFEQAMNEQRERAREARQDAGSMKVQGGALSDLDVDTTFVGYTEREVDTQVVAIIHQDQQVDVLGEGETGLVLLGKTPFYAESGGQVADRGEMITSQARLVVEDVQKAPQGDHVHQVRVEEGTLHKGDTVQARIEDRLRDDIVKNHTATHLLHKALKEVVGDHVNQAGSLVAPDRLRFDFTHIETLTEEQKRDVEERVNRQIWINTPVEIKEMPLEEAKAMGAMALFGEKYGDWVRVVQVGDYSTELCGGTHVRQTGEIGLFKLISEGGIGSGIRRVEAVTGRYAYRFMEEKLQVLETAAHQLKTSPDELPDRITTLQSRIKEMSRENESLRSKLNHLEGQRLVDRVEDVDGVPLLTAKVDVPDMDTLRQMVDDLKNQLEQGIIVLGTVNGGKVQLVASVSSDYVQAGYHAGKLVKEAATRCGGGGGGRPNMAQAGGKQPEKLDEALDAVADFIREHNVNSAD